MEMLNKELEEDLLNAIETLELIEEEDFAWYIDKDIAQSRLKAIQIITNYITENSIPKQFLVNKIKEIEKARDTANLLIERKLVIVDNDSLYSGERIAHNHDINILKELVEGK